MTLHITDVSMSMFIFNKIKTERFDKKSKIKTEKPRIYTKM